MASAQGLASSTELGILFRPSILFPTGYRLSDLQLCNNLSLKRCYRFSAAICCQQNPCIAKPSCRVREFRLFKAVELDQYITSDDEGEEMSEGFFEAIEELERMTREPGDILEEMNDRLSARELQLVLVYFSQEGRDSWCALEVFEWLKKENRVDKETMELMVSIMCSWVKNLIGGKHDASDVVDLLVDMDCVGLKPSFSMMEKVISLYWEMGKKEEAVLFVKDVLRRGITCSEDDGEGRKGGPTGYLAWKMMVDGDYRGAVKLVIHLRDSGLNPEIYSYLIAMTAVVKELNEFGKALRKFKDFVRSDSIAELDAENMALIEKYQSDLLADGLCLSAWVLQDGSSSLKGIVHERLLAMYICAGRGLEAEGQLWKMKLAGKEADTDLYDIVLAICASRKEPKSISRLLARAEVTSLMCKKKTLTWLVRGYIKGGHFDEAAEALIKMLDLGLRPEYLDRAAVLQGLVRRIQQSGNVDPYLKLCKHLSDANLIGPCLVYLYIKRYRLWIMRKL
ncbi:pentatricopeptide repeat-containing protein [Tripterygium wilfordii]|uniref:Pentatricopeptide repeat-containing protein n=1 Tax=Tripterygium wilfordii TaxID=458696 RepID=A0A7J7DEJ2_TRIWF|nr:pentatricopeptide repeat-containing protein At2g30100, chloroplastic-like [Tripterygium wilfordii]KAF5744486.1 pentatricopeptide repeat-containing protein [Tripterygium wilfordii]